MLHPTDAALDRALDRIRRRLDAGTRQNLDLILALARSPSIAPTDGRALLDEIASYPAVAPLLDAYQRENDPEMVQAALDAMLGSDGTGSDLQSKGVEYSPPDAGEIGSFASPLIAHETQAQHGFDGSDPLSACMLGNSPSHLPTTHTPLDPTPIPSPDVDPDTLLSTLVPASRTPAKGRPHMTHGRADAIRRAVLFADHQGTPLNCFLTITYRDHDVHRAGGSILDARHAVQRTLARFRPGPYVNSDENPERGGNGLHLHELLHLPPATYARGLDRLLTLLAKSFSGRLSEMCDQQRIPCGRDTSARRKYDLLLARKQEADRTLTARARARRSFTASRPTISRADLDEALDLAQQDVELRSLPFYVSFPNGQEGQPLPQRHVLERTLPYLLKPIDPETIGTDRHGKRTRLGDMERGATPTGDVPLQRQSKRRPKRSENIATSINTRAQQAAGWTLPPDAGPIEAVLSPGVRQEISARRVSEWLRFDADMREVEALLRQGTISKDHVDNSIISDLDLPDLSPIW